MIVCLDPGHGGWDPGAVGPAKTKESDMNLQIAKRVGDYLSPVVKVIFTRTGDNALSGPAHKVSGDLRARVITSDALKADCFVSIHCNAAGSHDAHGTETLYLSTAGKRLAEGIQNRLYSALATTNRGVKHRPELYVLKHTKAVAALVEVAFISNAHEEALLKTSDFQDRAAWAIASGIASYLGLYLTGKD